MHASSCSLALALVASVLVGCGQPPRKTADATSGDTRAARSRSTPHTPATQEDAARTWSLTPGPEGTLPAHFTSASGSWALGTAGGEHGLVQQGRSPAFNVLLIDDTNEADVDISVRVKAIEGEIDRGGGPLWRAKDGRNYYVVRWNPLEDNYRVYKVVDGMRTQLGGAAAKAGAAARILHVRMVGSKIECALDGEVLLRVEDATFPEAGKIGLWTKADARTLFSDLALKRP